MSHQPLRFPDQTKCHRLPIKVMWPEELRHQDNLKGNLELIRREFHLTVYFDYCNPTVRKEPFWIQGVLPSVYLVSMGQFRMSRVSGQLSKLVWPRDCGGIHGMNDRSEAPTALAVGDPAYLSTEEKCKEIASLFANCQMTDPDETWYVQGKFQFLMVLEHLPDGTIRQLKVCRSTCEDGFEISCVQRKIWNIETVVDAEGPNGCQLPVVVECSDSRGARATLLHCAWLPEKLISDFRATMLGRRHDEDGSIPPECVNPKLYMNGNYIPVRMRCFGRLLR